uniref:Solute carrier family 9 member B1 n=1 Tax=Homo sapiens TaxID=9606 RepID=D6RA80_HUMAN
MHTTESKNEHLEDENFQTSTTPQFCSRCCLSCCCCPLHDGAARKWIWC